MAQPDEVLSFWLDEVGPTGWYAGGDIDQIVRERFLSTWQDAQQGALGLWLTYPAGTLAYVILNDQFPRNMFRDTARAFSSDRLALTAAKMAISRGWDLRIDPPARHFFYMPLSHSEILADQDRAVRLMRSRMPDGGAGFLNHAKAHREIIRRFGRFPSRNAALARLTTQPEARYESEGGYRTALAAVSA